MVNLVGLHGRKHENAFGKLHRNINICLKYGNGDKV